MDVRVLIEKFYAGETTPEEERFLYCTLSAGKFPADIERERGPIMAMMELQLHSCDEEMAAMEAMIDSLVVKEVAVQPAKGRIRIVRRYLYTAMGAAAVLLMAFLLFPWKDDNSDGMIALRSSSEMHVSAETGYAYATISAEEQCTLCEPALAVADDRVAVTVQKRAVAHSGTTDSRLIGNAVCVTADGAGVMVGNGSAGDTLYTGLTLTRGVPDLYAMQSYTKQCNDEVAGGEKALVVSETASSDSGEGRQERRDTFDNPADAAAHVKETLGLLAQSMASGIEKQKAVFGHVASLSSSLRSSIIPM